MLFQKGQSGSPKGTLRKEEALRGWLQRVGRRKDAQGVTGDEAVIRTLYAKARGGDVGALRLILELRLGKPSIMEVSMPKNVGIEITVGASPDESPAK